MHEYGTCQILISFLYSLHCVSTGGMKNDVKRFMNIFMRLVLCQKAACTVMNHATPSLYRSFQSLHDENIFLAYRLDYSVLTGSSE